MKQKILFTALLVGGLMVIRPAETHAQVHVSVGINEQTYPGYTYYTYPAWHGHYRDRAYYDHYHARFYREHRAYFRDHAHFDHDRFERETHWHH